MRPPGGLVITGWSVVSAAGIGAEPLAELFSHTPPASPRREVADAFGEHLPATSVPVLTDFDVRAHLGRKGTNTYDRATGLAVVAAGQALRDAGTVVDDSTGPRVGVALGTTLGSLSSISDLNRVILTKPKPYLVNPALFPNTVMNSATAQVAIRYGLRGVNSTIAGGTLAFHQALRYAANAIDRGHADTMLVGAVEEFNAYRAWYAHRSAATSTDPTGEGAAVFVVQRAAGPGRTAGPGRAAEPGRETADGTAVDGGATVLGCATGFGHGDTAGRALPDCVRRLLRDCRVE
ncbi:MAG: beta-ketoacyl synthase N-terminal-like domain-containing protein, partial [Micromonosporaceae bacterium]